MRVPASSAVAIALISSLLAGCGGGVRQIAAPPTYGDVADLVAWVNATPGEFRPGETVQIEVGVRNPTPHPIIAPVNATCISYVVRDAGGTPVAPGVQCLAMVIPREMAPGEAIATLFSWDGTTPWERLPLPAGEYRVGSHGLPVAAPLVTIRILAPSASWTGTRQGPTLLAWPGTWEVP